MTKSEIFIKKAKLIHGNMYDYTNVDYIDNLTKVDITCKKHGSFFQTPRDHLNKCGCPICGRLNSNNKRRCENWKLDFIKTHGDRYDYSKVKYKNAKDEVEIICKEHGSFYQKPTYHKIGCGCPVCGLLKNRRNNIDFIDDFKKKHGDKYDYSKVDYKHCNAKIDIVCKKHGIFKQTPSSHISGSGCPICKISKGEERIMNYLIKKSINFSRQHLFDGCLLKNKLPFDFFLPDKNICIEYDGIQHFEPIDHFGGIKRLEIQKMKDYIKTKWCEENNIKLIRISYNDYDKIEDIISNYI